ncbi:MAG: carboxylesterase/lipase family protein, partial [Gammaproteobacteria bacterium]
MRCLLPFLIFVTALAQAAEDPLLVRSASGLVRGFAHEGVHEFRGIPFAASTAGEKRWTLPVPAPAWEGERDATRHGPGCPQVERYRITEASDAEDCLALDIAVPAAPAVRARPVFVWFYGGAFVGGASNLYLLHRLAREGDMVVVAGNYRIGALGFLSHAQIDAAANGALGLEDQRLLLRWVQQNIAAFGGDPDNVTIAGESAGAASVCLQLTAPLRSRGLFHRAIIQSAACTRGSRSTEEAFATASDLAARSGCGEASDSLACLRKVPLPQLLAAQTAIADGELLAFAPSVGSAALPRQVADAFRSGDFLRVPVMNGALRDEMRLYVGYEVEAGARVDAATYTSRIRAMYGKNADAVLARYPIESDAQAPAALGRLMSDFMPNGILDNCRILRTTWMVARQVPAYAYLWDDPGAPPVMKNPGFAMGSVHSAELPYLFPGFSNNRRYDTPALTPASDGLAREMIARWSAFARNGDPAVAGLPAWPRFATDADVMQLTPGASG